MESLIGEEFCDKIGEFLEEYVSAWNNDGGEIKLPRNVPYFKEAINVMIEQGWTKEEIRKACLKEKYLILPNFLFE